MSNEELTDEELSEAIRSNIGRVSEAETATEWFAALDAVVPTEKDDDWDYNEINEIVRLILNDRENRPDPSLRAAEAAGVIEARVRAYFHVDGPLYVPTEWEHRVPA